MKKPIQHVLYEIVDDKCIIKTKDNQPSCYLNKSEAERLGILDSKE